MSDASTPRPWRQATFMGVGPSGEKVFHCGLGLRGPAFSHEQVANAALIVRAVNAYDDLIAALRPFAEMADLDNNAFENHPDDHVIVSAGTIGRYWREITVGHLRRASAALTKAGR